MLKRYWSRGEMCVLINNSISLLNQDVVFKILIVLLTKFVNFNAFQFFFVKLKNLDSVRIAF
jgi:hypothetical protein